MNWLIVIAWVVGGAVLGLALASLGKGNRELGIFGGAVMGFFLGLVTPLGLWWADAIVVVGILLAIAQAANPQKPRL